MERGRVLERRECCLYIFYPTVEDVGDVYQNRKRSDEEH